MSELQVGRARGIARGRARRTEELQRPGLPPPQLAQGLPGIARGRARGRARKSEEPQRPGLTPTQWGGANPPVSAAAPGPPRRATQWGGAKLPVSAAAPGPSHRATQWGAAIREPSPEQGALTMAKTYRDNDQTECCIECGGVTAHFLYIPGITDPDGFTNCRHCFANLLQKRTFKHVSRCPKTRNKTRCLCPPEDDLCYRYWRKGTLFDHCDKWIKFTENKYWWALSLSVRGNWGKVIYQIF